MKQTEFFLPDRSVIESIAGETKSYAIYNYYGKGPIAAAKRARFRRALKMASVVETDRVIDMGCADGLLLPSLAKYFQHVAAIDVNPDYVARTQRLVDALKLQNVQVLCNGNTSIDELISQIGTGYKLMFCLETLEHVGSQPNMWQGKIDFLNDCFRLLDPGGQIVISVPKMVGMIMLFKNLLQRSLGMGYDQLTYRQLLRSAVLKDTDQLEPLWNGAHVGFNHLKLDQHLAKSFKIHERVESTISVFYRLGKA